MGIGITKANRLSLALLSGLLLFLFGGYLIDITGVNISNIQTMKALAIQPESRITVWGRCRQAHVTGRNLLLQRRYDEALPHLENGALCSDDPWAWYDLGQAHYGLGNLAQAADSWRHTQAGYDRAVQLAAMASENGSDAEIRAAWEFATLVNPGEQTAYIQLARLAVKSEPELVEPLLLDAIEADPDAPAAYIELGRYYQGLGRLGEAQRYFELAHHLAPTEISLLVTLAENAAALGDTPAAIDYWQQVALYNERRRALAYFSIGKLALDDNNLSSALAFFRRAAELEPDNLEYRLGMARAYFGLGCKQPAVEAYQEVLAATESEALMQEAQSKLAELAVMTTDTVPCPDGS